MKAVVHPGRLRILDVLPVAVIAPGPGRVVAVVARMDEDHFADAVLLNVVVNLVEKIEAGGLDTDFNPGANGDVLSVALPSDEPALA